MTELTPPLPHFLPQQPEKQIQVALNDSVGGGSLNISAKPYAHASGSSEAINGNELRYVIEEEYIVDKDVKSIKAIYTIHENGKAEPIMITKILPIKNPPEPVSIGHGFTALATLLK